MKRLVFIDNDHKERAEEDVSHAIDTLDYFFNLSKERLKNIEIVHDFFHMDKKDKVKLLFDPKTVILTWSMYTWNHFGSLGQILTFLKKAAHNDITGKVYIDCSGNFIKHIPRELNDDCKGLYSILNAIETNYIISRNGDYESFNKHKVQRVRVDLKGNYESPFKLEDISLKDIC